MDSRNTSSVDALISALQNDLNQRKFCCETNDIIKAGYEAIAKTDTLNAAIYFAGTLILAASFEDAKYGKQPEFKNELLYQHHKFDQLMQIIGTDAEKARITILNPKTTVRTISFFNADKSYCYQPGQASPLNIGDMIYALGHEVQKNNLPLKINTAAFPASCELIARAITCMQEATPQTTPHM